MSTSFRYSNPRFRETIAIAGGMTVLVAALAFMLLAASGSRHVFLWTASTAAVFFSFISARALIRFLRNETVLAVLPTGLAYARYRSQPLAWDAIREVVLRQAEDEYELDVYLWQPQNPARAAPSRPELTIELAPLDAPPAVIVESIGRHVRVRSETGQIAGLPG